MDEEATRREREFLERVQGYRTKREYLPVFGKPAGDWKVEANWDDAYFGAAREIVVGVVEGRHPKGVEGVAGLYLFRHYLELHLKYIILHSRWLKDSETIEKPDDVKVVAATHDLVQLWEMVKNESLPKIKDDAWKGWDLEFVEECVKEFQGVDTPKGERFRYHGARFGGKPEARRDEYLWIDFRHLLENMDHVRDVLRMLDIWFYETHGMIEDYISDMMADIGY